eukprot:CAMPEP_0183301874 /NCGR_PEP_ID=MMETSP0160_2-20130417/7855_1 /TAXON_ID=2839 ORGANISM="Odontella Sinensis, Strain Grunow 1884" /NCGR_SAMPLE_ID=MMETSP0160_2 /ASSEMBLY_ACC=CAM_ASM_000250 /LENGTH=325 /DNA_ID=CAMNT_0025464571 /DNA_START=30 /DNA_END=1007 /DNA_ORIENTATION=+
MGKSEKGGKGGKKAACDGCADDTAGLCQYVDGTCTPASFNGHCEGVDFMTPTNCADIGGCCDEKKKRCARHSDGACVKPGKDGRCKAGTTMCDVDRLTCDDCPCIDADGSCHPFESGKSKSKSKSKSGKGQDEDIQECEAGMSRCCTGILDCGLNEVCDAMPSWSEASAVCVGVSTTTGGFRGDTCTYNQDCQGRYLFNLRNDPVFDVFYFEKYGLSGPGTIDRAFAHDCLDFSSDGVNYCFGEDYSQIREYDPNTTTPFYYYLCPECPEDKSCYVNLGPPPGPDGPLPPPPDFPPCFYDNSYCRIRINVFGKYTATICERALEG